MRDCREASGHLERVCFRLVQHREAERVRAHETAVGSDLVAALPPAGGRNFVRVVEEFFISHDGADRLAQAEGGGVEGAQPLFHPDTQTGGKVFGIRLSIVQVREEDEQRVVRVVCPLAVSVLEAVEVVFERGGVREQRELARRVRLPGLLLGQELGVQADSVAERRADQRAYDTVFEGCFCEASLNVSSHVRDDDVERVRVVVCLRKSLCFIATDLGSGCGDPTTRFMTR